MEAQELSIQNTLAYLAVKKIIINKLKSRGVP